MENVCLFLVLCRVITLVLGNEDQLVILMQWRENIHRKFLSGEITSVNKNIREVTFIFSCEKFTALLDLKVLYPIKIKFMKFTVT